VPEKKDPRWKKISDTQRRGGDGGNGREGGASKFIFKKKKSPRNQKLTFVALTGGGGSKGRRWQRYRKEQKPKFQLSGQRGDKKNAETPNEKEG